MRDNRTVKIEVMISEEELHAIRRRIDAAYGRSMGSTLDDVGGFMRFMTTCAGPTPNFRGDDKETPFYAPEEA